MTNIKNPNFEKTLKKCDKTKKLKLCQNSKTEIDKKLKESNVYKTQKIELRQNSKTQIVTVVIVTVVTVVTVAKVTLVRTT